MRSQPSHLLWSLWIVFSLTLAACGTPDSSSTPQQPEATIASIVPSSTLSSYPPPQTSTALVPTATSEPPNDPWITPPEGPLLRDILRTNGDPAVPDLATVLAFKSAVAASKVVTVQSFDLAARRNTRSDTVIVPGENNQDVIMRLSSDNDWLALAIFNGDHTRLHVMKLGGQTEPVDLGITGPAGVSDCLPYFAWSPSGNRLAYKQYDVVDNQEGFSFNVFSPAVAKKPERTIFRSWADMIGWIDEAHILILSANTDSDLVLESIHVTSGRSNTISKIATNQTPYCEILSHNKEKAYIRTDERAFVIDIRLRTTTEISPPFRSQIFWGVDNMTLLAFPERGGATFEVLYAEKNKLSEGAILPLPYRTSSSFTLMDVSPDGRWLVICEGNAGVGTTWLYDISQNTLSKTASGPSCSFVVGWAMKV